MSQSANDSDLIGGGVTESREMTPLQVFFLKMAIVVAAVIAVLWASGYLLDIFIARQVEKMSALKGGPAFWATVEQKLYNLADAPDLPPEKKQKIIESLRKLSVKYRPYIDAINGEDAKGK